MLVGLDLSNSYTGIGGLDARRDERPARPPPLLWVFSLRGDGGAMAPISATRLLLRFDGLLERQPVDLNTVTVQIEKPPDIVSDDVAHGPQARIGFALGRLIGWVEAGLEARNVYARLVEVSPWRQQMLAWSTRWGVPAQAPGSHAPLEADEGARKLGRIQAATVERVANGLAVVWAGCGHKTATTFGGLATFPHRRCPECAGLPLAKSGDAKARKRWKTAAWKALACRLVCAHWPEPYAALVADARSRARSEKADHELAGVPDACEAVWIAVSALGNPGEP